MSTVLHNMLAAPDHIAFDLWQEMLCWGHLNTHSGRAFASGMQQAGLQHRLEDYISFRSHEQLLTRLL